MTPLTSIQETLQRAYLQRWSGVVQTISKRELLKYDLIVRITPEGEAEHDGRAEIMQIQRDAIIRVPARTFEDEEDPTYSYWDECLDLIVTD